MAFFLVPNTMPRADWSEKNLTSNRQPIEHRHNDCVTLAMWNATITICNSFNFIHSTLCPSSTFLSGWYSFARRWYAWKQFTLRNTQNNRTISQQQPRTLNTTAFWTIKNAQSIHQRHVLCTHNTTEWIYICTSLKLPGHSSNALCPQHTHFSNIGHC